MNTLKKITTFFVSILFLFNLSTCLKSNSDENGEDNGGTDNGTNTNGTTTTDDMLTREDALPSYSIPDMSTITFSDPVDNSAIPSYFFKTTLRACDLYSGCAYTDATVGYIAATAVAVTSIAFHTAVLTVVLADLWVEDSINISKDGDTVTISYTIEATYNSKSYEIDVLITLVKDEDDATDGTINLTCEACDFDSIKDGVDFAKFHSPEGMFKDGEFDEAGEGYWELYDPDTAELLERVTFKITDELDKELIFDFLKDGGEYEGSEISYLAYNDGDCSQVYVNDTENDKETYIVTDVGTDSEDEGAKEGFYKSGSLDEACWGSDHKDIDCVDLTTDCAIQSRSD